MHSHISTRVNINWIMENMGSIYLLLGWLWSASLIFLEEGHYQVQSLISLFRELEVITFVPDHDPDQKWRIWVVKCLWYHFPINLVDVLVIILATFYRTQERRIPLYHACTSGHCTKLRWNCNKQERLDPFIPCLPLHRATATDSFLPQLFCARDHAAAAWQQKRGIHSEQTSASCLIHQTSLVSSNPPAFVYKTTDITSAIWGNLV